MAHAPRTIAELRARYVAGQPLEAAARELAVSEGTARRWRQDALRRGDDWRAARGGIALPPIGVHAAIAAIERLEAQLGEGLAATQRDILELATLGAAEFDRGRGTTEDRAAALRRELRRGFAAVLILGALVAVSTVLIG